MLLITIEIPWATNTQRSGTSNVQLKKIRDHGPPTADGR